MSTATISVAMSPSSADAGLQQAIANACGHIAPAWPLDRLIAVNPYWGFVDAPIERAAAELQALSGTTLLMPRHWYHEQFDAGRFTERHVAQAIEITGAARTSADVIAALARDAAAPTPWRLMTDVTDAGRDLGHAMSWNEYAVRHISQTCAACFDEGQARWTPDRSNGLYPLWRELAVHDGGPRLLMQLHGFREAAAALPVDPHALIAEALDELEVPQHMREQYLTALLLSVNGWASVCAYRRWEARLAGSDDAEIVHLLAVRLAWELVLFRLCTSGMTSEAWRTANTGWTSVATSAHTAHRDDWLLQRALEIAYQERVSREISAGFTTATSSSQPISTQAVFCIDVRSEVFRRSLEHVAPTVQTLGFAGFFGLPIAYQPLSGPVRAQLPGLLSAAMIVEDAGAGHAAATDDVRRTLSDAASWKSLGATAASTFSFVEATGIAAAVKLVRDGFGLRASTGDTLRGPATSHTTLRPELSRRADGSAVPLEARVGLAQGILGAMSLTTGFAPLLALIGHGASTENNPMAAGLHCGACGGQTGEVNARALAALLNDTEVRAGLKAAGINLGDTHVVGGLHDTTTDEITLYDLDRAPASHAEPLAALQQQFDLASIGARRERAESLGLDPADASLHRAVRHRSRDWAEVRPEWGLAGNAAFVVAPRVRTKAMNLQGRSFLHDYIWQQDSGFGVLELILTAPMVVTNWINLQYYASVVDPLRYGSGNKVLHNVVGGRIGVMEGAGGDLRIGLAMQSVHDGTRWMHDPLRLSVFVEAPAEAIDAIIAKHAVVRDLVDGEWLFLHRIDSATGAISLRLRDRWQSVHSG